MRAFIPNIITEKDIPERLTRKSWDAPVIIKILEGCKYLFDKPILRGLPSYIRLEDRNKEHPWHTDTGTKGHMMWCEYSISVLVSKPSKGGLLKYKNPIAEYKPEDRYLGAIVHTNNEWHMREMARGKYRVILLFLGCSSIKPPSP